MSYEKPKGLLLDAPAKRKLPKSPFLRKLEREQMAHRIVNEAMRQHERESFFAPVKHWTTALPKLKSVK